MSQDNAPALAIYDDGSLRGPRVPGNAAGALTMARGATQVFKFVVERISGVPDDVAGPAYTLTIKKRSDDLPALVARIGQPNPGDGPGRLDFTIVPQDTRFLVPGRYVYDVWREAAGVRSLVVPASPFILTPAVADVGQAVTGVPPMAITVFGLPPLAGIDYSALVEHPVGTLAWAGLEDVNVRGGFQVQPSTTTRDAIPASRRKEGMQVYTVADGNEWRLNSDLTTWTQLTLSGNSIGFYAATTAVQPGDAVAITGDDAVDQAVATDAATRAVGFCLSKPTSTSAVVQYTGELAGLSGLVAGTAYVLSDATPGGLLPESTPPSGAGSIIQKVGTARSTTTLVLMVTAQYLQI